MPLPYTFRLEEIWHIFRVRHNTSIHSIRIMRATVFVFRLLAMVGISLVFNEGTVVKS